MFPNVTFDILGFGNKNNPMTPYTCISAEPQIDFVPWSCIC